MKVLFVNHTGEVSGAERSLLDLLRGLQGPGDWGPIEALVACNDTGSLAEALGHERVTTQRIDAFSLGFSARPLGVVRIFKQFRAVASQVAEVAREFGADIIHANSIRAGLIACAARPRSTVACARKTVHVVVHVRDCLPASVFGKATRRFLGRHADLLIANSHYTKASLCQNDAVMAAKIRVVYNPVDLVRFDPDVVSAQDIRRELALAGSFPIIVLAAQITPWKGHVDAISAMSVVIRLYPKAKLLIVGAAKFSHVTARFDNAAYEKDLRRMVIDLGLTACVHFTSEREDMPAVYQAADIVLLPSWEEPFGRTVVEAMAMRKSVIATRVGGPAEIINNGVTGFLISPRNAEDLADMVLQVAGDGELRVRVGEAAMDSVVRRFGLQQHATAVTDVYRELLETSGGHRL